MTWFRSEQNSRQTRPKQRVLAITLITGFGKIIKILNHDVYLVSNRTENVLSQMTVTGPDKHNASSPSPVTQPWGQKKPNMSLYCILGSLFLIPSLIVSVKNSLVTVCIIVMTSNLLIHAQHTQWMCLYFYRAKKSPYLVKWIILPLSFELYTSHVFILIWFSTVALRGQNGLQLKNQQ